MEEVNDLQKPIDIALSLLVDGLRQAKSHPSKIESAIYAMRAVADFLSLFPAIAAEGLLDTITLPMRDLLDLQDGIQAEWLKPALRSGGRPKSPGVDALTKEHAVVMVRWLNEHLGEPRSQAVKEVKDALEKARFSITVITLNKWISSYNTTQRQSDERKRQDKLLENLKADYDLQQNKQSKAVYLQKFSEAIKQRTKKAA